MINNAQALVQHHNKVKNLLKKYNPNEILVNQISFNKTSQDV